MTNAEKVNVLMVDDHPENLLALEAILESLGQNLVKAHSGEEALRCLLNRDFAVILLDVQMPGMDGFETATLIRQRQRSRHTPIIFLTAFSTSDSFVFKGYSKGAVDYLLKPIDPEILKSKVAVFIDLFQKNQEVKKQAEQLAAINAELRESEEKFRRLSACSPVGISVADIDGRCTYTNPRYQAITGITLEESLGEGWMQAVHPEDRERVISEWINYTRRRQEYASEFRIEHKEGSIRWVQFRSSVMLCEKGKAIGYVGTLEDITARKEGEEARAAILREQIARQQAEAANRLKDEFLATLSHELRTPLNSILGWARLLRTRNFDPETTAKALETIERNAKLQAQLTEDILDVSRIIRGKLRLALCPVNLVEVIEGALDAAKPQAEAKNILLQTWSDFDGIQVFGDRNRLQQIVWNLISNAIKFTPEGGKVEIKVEPAGAWALLKVIDTGIGINKQFLPFVFDRFRQADGQTTRTYGGLGLGLAIVHHLVKLHGGSVVAESDGEGMGSTFTVKLPLKKETVAELLINRAEEATIECPPPSSHPQAQKSPLSATPALTGLRVLVVDDDPDVRELVAVVLEEYGAKVTAVSSAPEAINALPQLQPDVLVSDIGMPEEDGYSLIRQVRNLDAERGKILPAAALTAYAREEDCQGALDAGFQMHLSKPVDTAKLVMAVANLAGRTAVF